jgi:predicted Zn finger-like uncharacterized protein
MYSQCPECLTRFRVTAAALRIARGTVRCGRCGSAFDALPQLTDTLPDDAAFPAAPAALGFTGATVPEVLEGSDDLALPEFQFSADDIEQVFIDARDWQSRFGAAASPGDRAGRLGESGAGLAGLLFAPLDDFVAPAPQEGGTERGPNVWVHEPEAVEDITLEGERIQIEGIGDAGDSAEEERLEREIAAALDEQHRAEIAAASGTHRQMPDDAGLMLASDGLHDLDSTDRFEVLAEAPAEAPDAHGADEPPAPAEVTAAAAAAAAAVATAAVAGPAIAAATTTAAAAPTMPAPAAPQASPTAARWQRPWPADSEPEPAADLDLDGHEQLAADLAVAASERRGSWAWGIGALLLALALAAQWIHQHRQDLARDARLGPALRSVYSSLGTPLAPSWDLAAFEVRQWGASEAPPADGSTMTVRASLKNGASFAQPLPLLRLEFEDRFGATVARRDFEPREYLDDPEQATRLLAAGSTTAAALAIVDAAPEAVGYRLDVCMRNDDGAVRCAHADAGLP